MCICMCTAYVSIVQYLLSNYINIGEGAAAKINSYSEKILLANQQPASAAPRQSSLGSP